MRILATFFAICLSLTLANGALAQSYPDPMSKTVNDFAGLLDAESEALIDAELVKLEKDTGLEMTVVTLSRRDMFTADQSFEEFATGLFNAWGIGDKTRNDGILVLVMHTDRDMRIELGSGFGTGWNNEAGHVIERSFLPAFRGERYQQGIEKGVADVIETIARPFHAGADEPSGKGLHVLLLALFGLPIAAMLFLERILNRFRRCPSCGARGIRTSRDVKRAATKSRAGDGIKTTTCRHCDHRTSERYTISRKSKSSGSSFGGGRSSGGGASGKW